MSSLQARLSQEEREHLCTQLSSSSSGGKHCLVAAGALQGQVEQQEEKQRALTARGCSSHHTEPV